MRWFVRVLTAWALLMSSFSATGFLGLLDVVLAVWFIFALWVELWAYARND